MSTQPGTSRLPVAFAAFFLVAAVAAFGASFYLLDGVSLVTEAVGSLLSSGAAAGGSRPATVTAEPAKLELPDGMPEEFALRLWQEQLDSQEMIGRLVSGEITSLKVDRVATKGDEAKLFVTVTLRDLPKASGVIGLKRYGGDWYIAGVTSTREGAAPSRPSDLPSIDEVDIALLNTMIAENRKSQKVIGEYLAGIVREVHVEDITVGPKTATLEIEMDETHGEGYANLVAIQIEVNGELAWFLARFDKTGHNPPHL